MTLVMILVGTSVMASSQKDGDHVMSDTTQISYHFATKTEGQKRIAANTQYYNRLTQNDIEWRMKKTGAEVVRQLIKMGVMASVSNVIDYDTAALVAMELGCKVEREVIVTIEERLIDDTEDRP